MSQAAEHFRFEKRMEQITNLRAQLREKGIRVNARLLEKLTTLAGEADSAKTDAPGASDEK